MKHTTLSTAIVLALGVQGATAAESLEQKFARMEAELQTLKQQIAEQQSTISSQQETIDRQQTVMDGTPKRIDKLEQNLERRRASSGDDAWFNRMEIGGVVEVEAGYHSPYEGDSESDIVLATFELGISAAVTDWIEVEGTLLYEEDGTDLEVDVARITIANPDASPFSLTAGQIYVPFGMYETNLVSDPLTLEIGEARETALQIGFIQDGFDGALYLFNGSNKKNGRNEISSWGANLGYGQGSDDMSWAAAIGYISDVGDSDLLQDVIADNLGSNDIRQRVPAWTIGANVSFGPFHLIGEYLAATKSFESAAVPWGINGAQPSAWNLEVGYGLQLMGKDATVALAFQGTREALALELPRERWLLGISIDILNDTALSFEWAWDDDYDIGTGESADTVTAQLAVEF